MKNIYLYAHGGSGNHGCEAIVRSTIKMFENLPVGQKILVSRKNEEDIKYGIDQICQIEKDVPSKWYYFGEFFKAYLELRLKKNFIPMDKLEYKKRFNSMKKGDIALSIGGDNYCYADVQSYILMHDVALEKKAKTILWGCSIEPEIIRKPEITADLSRYRLVTARETISYEALKKINSNTILVADPAFTLPSIMTDMPDGFEKGNMVGINVSPMVIENEIISGITLKSYEKLLNFILDKTDMGIALIPHVVWDEMDDRIPLMNLYERYKDSGRMVMIDDCNCMKIKGIISMCRFFVGARTHATIAAYSTGIPTLAVGYSVKARGIARDIFGTEANYVIPVQNLQQEETLVDAFKYIMENEKKIKLHLENFMPDYCQKAYKGIEEIKKMFNE